MNDIPLDWLAISLATFLHIALRFAWYSSWLFPIPFSWGTWGICALGSFFFVFFQAFFQLYLGITTVLDGMFVGGCFWMGLVFPAHICLVRGRFFAIHGGFWLLSCLGIGGFLAA